MQADRIPRSIEDFMEEVDRRLNRLELRAAAGFVDTNPSQILYDNLPADTRDNDLTGGALPEQLTDEVITPPAPTIPPHSHDEGGSTVSLPQGMVIRLVWNGTTYPTKPAVPGAYFEFVGPTDPETLNLMSPSDTWTETTNV